MKKFVILVLLTACVVGWELSWVSGDVASAEETEWFEDEDTEEALDAEESAANGKVFLEGEFLNHDILKVDVLIAEMEIPVLGIAFHFLYDPAGLDFLKYDPGDFLERGGDPFYLVGPGPSGGAGLATGRLVVGETLRRNDSFPVGDGVVAEFYFQRMDSSAQAYEFSFEHGVVSTLDTVRQDIDKVEFVGGVLDESGMMEEAGGVFGDEFAANVAGRSAGILEGRLWMVFVIAGVVGGIVILYFLKKFAILRRGM